MMISDTVERCMLQRNYNLWRFLMVPINLGSILTMQSEKTPRKKFLDFKGKKYTYKMVESISNKISRYIVNLGIKPGDRVAIMMGNSPEFIFALNAVLKSGAVAVPINTFLKQYEVAYILNNCEAKLLFTSKQYEEVVGTTLKNTATIEKVLSFSPDLELNNSIDIYKNIEMITDKPLNLEIEPTELALIIYTSGTTGEPKGAMLSHANIYSCVSSTNTLYPMGRKDRFLLFLPMFHIYSLAVSILWPTFLGASIIILESVLDLKKKSFRNILLFKRPTLMAAVPSIYSALAYANIPNWFIKFFYPIKFHLSSGSGLPTEVFQAFRNKFKASIIEGYGISETSPVVAANRLNHIKPGSVGKPLSDEVQVKILDDESNEMPLGEVGEIVVKGPNIMQGYWKMPKETKEVLKNGWFFTGDLGYIDKNDGCISIVDRKKDLILVKGMNVYPREVEELIYTVDGVEACAVIGVPEPNGDEIIIAYIKKVADVILHERDIKKYLRENLANFKIPKYVYFSDDIPMTTIGKVLKRKLREMVINGEMKGKATVTGSSHI